MKKPLYQRLYFQVLAGISLGVLLGIFAPEFAIQLKPFGDVFIRLIKMMVAPIIFCTIVVGIAKMGDMKEVGRVGLKALIYFEVVSTIALLLGLLVVNLYKPGVGLNADPASLSTQGVATYAAAAQNLGTIDFILNIIPHTAVGAFTQDNILQVLLFSVLFGLALSHLGAKGQLLIKVLDQSSHVFFGVIGIIMRFAPFGACGSMAFSIGKYGFITLLPLLKLVLGLAFTCLLFVIVILGPILRSSGFSIWKFIRYIKEEIFIVLATSSSEAALPRMISKLENMGCGQSVVGLVIPTGYSFNLDGTSIYLTMAAIFIAQALNVDLSIYQQLSLLGVLMLTSKGAAGITGAGFVTLASTLSIMDTLPVAGLSLLVGVDLFMSEIRAVTNIIGNGVATIVISKWEKALDFKKAHRVLDGDTEQEADSPEAISDATLEDPYASVATSLLD
jgi:aerobic C4-dicarboxylate transport protein